jgi:pSer/pThr/pTyr-binding forkhead associated (FHA) protein
LSDYRDDVFCHNCGHRNPEGVNFCSSCGAALQTSTVTTVAFIPEDQTGEISDDELRSIPVEVPGGTGILIVKRGPDAGSRYTLEAPITRVGRHPESDIFLDDITVSRRHAEFLHQDSTYSVRDVGSLNGTYLNRERVDEVELQSGDEVQIGKFKLVFLTAKP